MSTRSIGSLLVCLLPVCAFALTGCASTGPKRDVARDGVFVHIKSGPAATHEAMMGLRMAQLMAADHDVLVYFDVNGIELVTRDAPDLKTEPLGSSRAILSDLASRKVTLLACPGCLQAKGKKPGDLLPGVKVAEKEAFFGFTEGRILTLDY